MQSYTATLDVNLQSLRSNYLLLKKRHVRQSLSAVVKANAYGLGVDAVSKALWLEGCRMFFVATLAEALQLRKSLPDARIGVFNGVFAGEEKKYVRAHLTPVLNELEQAERWIKIAPAATPAILHVDTGMTRLGLNRSELERLVTRHHSFIAQQLALVISHLACANEPNHPKNAEQLVRFQAAMHLLPGIKGSLCNSSGLFLPPAFHFDMGRPGCALYGINPTETINPMRPVVTLSAPLLQIRTLNHNETIGYGATACASPGSRIAITALGYADGWPRLLSNNGYAFIAGHKVAIAGRISMDMIALDVSKVPEAHLGSGIRAEFINTEQSVDDIASACGTIGYEILTGIGTRVARRYIA